MRFQRRHCRFPTVGNRVQVTSVDGGVDKSYVGYTGYIVEDLQYTCAKPFQVRFYDDSTLWLAETQVKNLDLGWKSCFWTEKKGLAMATQNRKRFSNNDLQSLARFLASQNGFPAWKQEMALAPHATFCLQEVDVGNNNHGNEGLDDLVAALKQHDVQLRILKLHKNQLSSGCVPPLMDLLQNSLGPVYQLHLSHNYLGVEDVIALILSAAGRQDYPLARAGPLWLRVEQQLDHSRWPTFVGLEAERRDVGDKMLKGYSDEIAALRQSLGLMPALPEDRRGPMLCMPEKPWPGCNTTKCTNRHTYGPIVHLP